MGLSFNGPAGRPPRWLAGFSAAEHYVPLCHHTLAPLWGSAMLPYW